MKNKLRSGRTILAIILAILVIVLLAAVMVIWKKFSVYGDLKTNTETIQTENEADEIPQENKDTIPPNLYSSDGFYEVNDIRFYYANGCEGIAGIDVSSYQKEIDWNAVRHAGIEFAIVRVGYRGWSSGELDLDDCFHDHMQGAIDAGLDVGVYFFSQALTVGEAVEEANYTLDLIKEYDVKGPVVFDWEEVEAADARTNDMNMLLLTSCAQAFCQTVEEAGYDAAVYFNQGYGYNQLNLESLKDYDFWLAEYAAVPTFAHNFQMWQYTNEGTVPGIDGNVDLNILFRDKQ